MLWTVSFAALQVVSYNLHFVTLRLLETGRVWDSKTQQQKQQLQQLQLCKVKKKKRTTYLESAVSLQRAVCVNATRLTSAGRMKESLVNDPF